MKYCRRAQCLVEGCGVPGEFFFLDGDPKVKVCACSQHKKLGMVPAQKSKRCRQEGCKLSPHYNFPGEEVGEWCATHKLEGMQNFKKHPTCSEEGCKRCPVFNFERKKVGGKCHLHKLPGMKDFTLRYCTIEGCRLKAEFHFPEGDPKVRVCSFHKELNMVPLPKQKLLERNCVTCGGGIPRKGGFIFPDGDPNERFCSLHKKPGMVPSLKSDRCRRGGCARKPYYNFVGAKKGEWCTDHKLDGMRSFKKRSTCYAEGCKRCPVFNFEGERGGGACRLHKLPGMLYRR